MQSCCSYLDTSHLVRGVHFHTLINICHSNLDPKIQLKQFPTKKGLINH
jgi:hypothetical protein